MKAILVVQTLILLVLVWIGTHLEREQDPRVGVLHQQIDALPDRIAAAVAQALPQATPLAASGPVVPHAEQPVATDRTPVGATAEDRLLAAAEALERAATQLRGPASVPSRHQLPASNHKGALNDLAKRFAADERAAARTCLLWSLADVLEHFGRPDWVRPTRGSSRMVLAYQVHGEQTISFVIHEGLVVTVNS